MIAAATARHDLERLGLPQAAAVLDGRLATAARQQVAYADCLADLLAGEAAARRQRYLRTRTRLAQLPFPRPLQQLAFVFQPTLDQRLVRGLATLTFLN